MILFLGMINCRAEQFLKYDAEGYGEKRTYTRVERPELKLKEDGGGGGIEGPVLVGPIETLTVSVL